MTLVAGIDSSTQACKVTIRDLATGERMREGKASHPTETIVDPEAWWDALLVAVNRAGGLADVAAISVSGQQHTPIFLDASGRPVCDSPLWNDTGSHRHMVDLNNELGRDEWIRRTGLPITLSDTITKLRWLQDTNPEAVERTAAVAIVHDWLTWRLMGYGPGTGGLDKLTTDRSEASGTGYWSGDTGEYTMDLFEHAFGKAAMLPRILGPLDQAGVTGSGITGVPAGIPIGVGSGDNAAAALALGLAEGDAVLSLGTSGVVYARTARPVHDYSGFVCSYADATGDHLPLVATLNAARNLDVGAALLGCSHAELSDLALQADPGADGLTLLPYFEGERTPDLPNARGSLLGASLSNLTRPNFARSVIEGTLASQVEMLDLLRNCGVDARRLVLIGGGALSPAVQQILGQMVSLPVSVPNPEQYVTKGAAMQAASTLEGAFPDWDVVSRDLEPLPFEPSIALQHHAAKVTLGYEASGPATSTNGQDSVLHASRAS
ncbi:MULTISPECIES: FGGY family carbohydrate kinase [unclassified Frondihabitans]|uniref:FGGY family carbohydrate kinase n=1 Tax=unclassified Frondihabitans TaxID=2626248 RepID=UPI000F4E1AA3|nr:MULTISPECIES: FGGY family carbohydrate kinase [unclassified Frondihabitans]RPE77844.1 xylulokinase [Frondihabitans sp. PhB153]RPF08123.1 xylulokinase [Frondihabitans sp. PhB161]